MCCSTPAFFALACFPFAGKQRQAKTARESNAPVCLSVCLPARLLSRLASLLWLVPKVQYLHSPSPTQYHPPHPTRSPHQKPSPPSRPTAPLSFVVLDIVVAVVVIVVVVVAVVVAVQSPLVANVSSLSSTLAAHLLSFSFLFNESTTYNLDPTIPRLVLSLSLTTRCDFLCSNPTSLGDVPAYRLCRKQTSSQLSRSRTPIFTTST